jgi:hypothetical protein
MEADRSLEDRLARISSIGDTNGTLEGNIETTMSQGAADSRPDQLATLNGIAQGCSNTLFLCTGSPTKWLAFFSFNPGLDNPAASCSQNGRHKQSVNTFAKS